MENVHRYGFKVIRPNLFSCLSVVVVERKSTNSVTFHGGIGISMAYGFQVVEPNLFS